MKIAIISDDFPPKSFGGAGIIAFLQAQELQTRGHEVIVVTAETDGRGAGRTVYKNLPVYLVKAGIGSEIEKLLSEFKPDISHLHNVHQALSFKTISIAKKHSKAVFLTAHDAMSVHYGKIYPKTKGIHDKNPNYKISPWFQLRYYWRVWSPFRGRAIRHYLDEVNQILSVSNALGEALRQNGIPNVKTLHNGIDTRNFAADSEKVQELKAKLGLQNKKVMLFGGRLSRAKGGERALDLLVDLSKNIPNICLLVVGQEDAYAESLKAKAKEFGVLDSLIFTGWINRDEMPSVYGIADLVLTLSTYLDPFPTINLEAMASGKPVLGTYLGGTPEAVRDGSDGFIVDPNDRQMIADKSSMILKNDDLAAKFGQNARERSIQEFDIAKNINTLEEMYRSFI